MTGSIEVNDSADQNATQFQNDNVVEIGTDGEIQMIELEETSGGHGSNLPGKDAKPPLAKKRKRCPPKDAATSGKRAMVWDHVAESPTSTPSNPRALCKYCSIDLACDSTIHGTSTMNRHLRFRCRSLSNPYTAARIDEVRNQNGQTTLYHQSKLKFGSSDGDNNGIGSASGGVKSLLFKQDIGRDHLTRMIIVDEMPFDTVEREGFRTYSYYLQPKFVIPSRFTVKRDVMSLYGEEKKKLQKVLKVQRVCLTTDAWTSIQNLSYMCLTCHWIDDTWKYQKRILNFCLLPNHKGETIGKTIESCLAEWGVEKILTITLDNASANNSAIKHLKKRKTGFLWKDNVADHTYLHMRCCAHIINLIVKAGLKKMHDSIARIRNAVKYVKSSPSRTQSFDSCVKSANITHKHKLVLDVDTRWNSTYLMLESAEKYERAFDRLSEEDGKYSQYFNVITDEDESDEDDDDPMPAVKGKTLLLGPPQDSDWENSRVFIKFLKLFYEMTLKFSTSTYVTSNEFFHEIIHLHRMLKKHLDTCDPLMSSMANAMALKFKKYWGDFNGINGLLFVAVLLDPRYKIKYIKYCFGVIYGKKKGDELAEKVEAILLRLYEQYSQNLHIFGARSSVGSSSSQVGVNEFDESIDDDDVRTNWERQVFEEHNLDHNNEVVRYLGEQTELIKSTTSPFDILDWWKVNAGKYPVLAQIARHVLAIPVSTVASESAFSTGGRILDPYRSSLAPKTVEALVCAQNWLRSTPGLFDPKHVGFLVDEPDEITQTSGTPPPSNNDSD